MYPRIQCTNCAESITVKPATVLEAGWWKIESIFGLLLGWCPLCAKVEGMGPHCKTTGATR